MPLDKDALERLAQLPALMRERKQWLVWRFEQRDGEPKPRKVPYYVGGRRRRGTQGDDDDRHRLATFEAAVATLGRNGWDGLGFAFLPGDGLIGIDIDGGLATDPDTGELVPTDLCRSIVEACASYTELSPSGKGVHIIVQGETQTFKDNGIGLEVFCGSQYFTCTGQRWGSDVDTVEPIADKTLGRLRATVESARAKHKGAAAPATVVDIPVPALDDFRRVNQVALALLDAWVPALLPDAKRGSQGWRVSSKALGRELQEDLSITPQGIKDWGVHDMGDAKGGGRTPIDLVVEHAGKTPKEALRWLADACGVRLTTRNDRRRAAQGSRAGPDDEGGSTPSPGSAEDDDGPPDEPPDRDEPPPSDPPERERWRQRLQRGNNGLKDCRENVYLVLANHPQLKGLVGYDEFAHRVVKLTTPPWGGPLGEWSTNDDYRLGLWLAERMHLLIKAEGTLIAGVAMAAVENKFHPVHEYLHGLKPWDGIERLGHWLVDCLGAREAESEYAGLVGTWFIMGMVKRVLEPGCQMDYMVVLEGLQGKRKSTALRTLVGNDEWFADTPMRLGDKDAMLSLAGKWLYEVGELDAFNKAEVTAVKQYVSSRIDRVREPFARRPSDRPRSGVFAGSTNQSEYFKDPTGARRFWPVACDGAIEIEKLGQWRDQLFAEAMVRLKDADPERSRYWPTREETDRLLVPQQEQREIVDPWTERLVLWLDSKATYAESGLEICEVDNFTTHELLTRCLMVPTDRIDGGRQMATRVGIAMHKLGWEKKRDAAGARVWRYWRPEKRKPAAVEAAASATPARVVTDMQGEGPLNEWS
jgi:putative DNA primase/helicase